MQDQGHSRSRSSNVNVIQGQSQSRSRPLKVKVIQGQSRSLKIKVISWSISSQGHSHFEAKVILESNGNVF